MDVRISAILPARFRGTDTDPEQPGRHLLALLRPGCPPRTVLFAGVVTQGNADTVLVGDIAFTYLQPRTARELQAVDDEDRNWFPDPAGLQFLPACRFRRHHLYMEAYLLMQYPACFAGGRTLPQVLQEVRPTFR